MHTWLDSHPRFHMHYTPTYSSWINQVERWFAYLTEDLLRRSDHRSVQAFEKDIRESVAGWNENPKSFIWVKTAEQILQSISRLPSRGSTQCSARLGDQFAKRGLWRVGEPREDVVVDGDRRSPTR